MFLLGTHVIAFRPSEDGKQAHSHAQWRHLDTGYFSFNSQLLLTHIHYVGNIDLEKGRLYH